MSWTQGLNIKEKTSWFKHPSLSTTWLWIPHDQLPQVSDTIPYPHPTPPPHTLIEFHSNCKNNKPFLKQVAVFRYVITIKRDVANRNNWYQEVGALYSNWLYILGFWNWFSGEILMSLNFELQSVKNALGRTWWHILLASLFISINLMWAGVIWVERT